MTDLRISIVIPVYDEAGEIHRRLDHLRRLTGAAPHEVIVADGHPEATTVRTIRDASVVTVVCGQGRGLQMNRGAAAASGDVLLFLHVDTRLPPGALAEVIKALADTRIVGGAFDLGIASPKASLRLIARAASLRSRLTREPYGDQAQFVRRRYFAAMGGFKEIPIMEDVDLMRRIRRRGDRIRILPRRVLTSPRRWQKEGIIYATLRNWALMSLYNLGVSPQRLVRYYR